MKTKDIRELIDNEEYIKIVNVNVTSNTKGFLFKTPTLINISESL